MKTKHFGIISLLMLFAVLMNSPAQTIRYEYNSGGELELAYYETNTPCTSWFQYDPAGNITNQIISGALEDPDQNKDGTPDAWALVFYNTVTPDGAEPVVTVTPFPTATPTPSVTPTPIPVPTPSPSGGGKSIISILWLLFSRL